MVEPPNDKRDLRHDDQQDEFYWKALLAQGENAVCEEEPEGDWSFYEDDYTSAGDAGSPWQDSQKEWKRAQETLDSDISLDLPVIGFNKGGLLVAWESLRGFVPASQLIGFPVDVEEAQRRSLLTRYLGRDLHLRIIELDVSKNRLILSERAAQVGPGQRASVMKQITRDTVITGIVTNLCEFGAFIDLGGVEGLIHISELSWGRVNHPRDILSSGKEVNVYVMEVNADEERIALSLKRLSPDPWATVAARYTVGQVVRGTITNVVDFGAFACIEEGLEGLIHISELAEGQFLHPRNVVREGDVVEARILNIDGPSRRLGLSLRVITGGEGQ
jgi:small subunit ribosomal protein S1